MSPAHTWPTVRAKIVAGDDHECWRWTGHHTPDGYAVVSFGGKPTLVHRLAYENLVGQIPSGLQIDHLCRNRACVNPQHLEPVTLRENVVRGISLLAVNARKTHCLRGHPLDAVNTYIVPKTGVRSCKTCTRMRKRRIDRASRAMRRARAGHRVAEQWVDVVIVCVCGWRTADRTKTLARESWKAHIDSAAHELLSGEDV